MKPLPRFLILSVCAALALIGLVPNVFAGAMFRCRAPDGTTAITNRPEGYVACTKVPHSDYAEPAQAAAHKAAVKPGPPVPVAAAALSSDSKAASATAHAATEPAPTEPVQRQQARSAYKSMPPSAFADVVSETRLNGGAPSRSDANVVERPDKLTQVRRGAVYKVARANGVIEYTNVRPGAGAFQTLFTYIATCYACDVKSAINFATLALNLDAYRQEIAASASEFGIDQALLRAVIHAESAFNPNAISVKGAQGLMQLMPATASDMGVSSPFDPAQNIRGGARYLSMLLKMFNGDEHLAAAAYNAGPQSVQKYSGVPPYDETRVYVQRVTTLRKRYGEVH